MSDRAAAAHAWARRGRLVLPVGRNKTPLTAHGLLDATTDASTINGWLSRWPELNIGVRTGACSGIVVLDIDGDEGADSRHLLEQQHGELPATASVKTPRGGEHRYFAHPGDKHVKTCAGTVAPGIDIRGDGGYVLVPPSIGANGRRYEWDEHLPLAPMPEWLLEAVADMPQRRTRTPVSEWVAMVEQGLPEGQRNSGLTRLVGHLLSRDVNAHLVVALAQLVNTRSRPPLLAQEVDRIVESIAGKELRKRAKGSAR